MAAFQITGSGLIDLRATNMTGFDGLTFATTGAATAQLNATQFGAGGIQGTPVTFTGNAQANALEFFVSATTLTLSAVVFANWSANDTITIRDTTGNENITGTIQNDVIFVTGGADNVDGAGGTDTLNLDWSAIGGSVSMNGPTQFTNFAGTSVNFSNIENFNILLGSGNDTVVLGNNADTVSGGDGNDTLNTALGNATVDGGLGNDAWVADLSSNATAATVNLNLGGTRNTGTGSTYTGIEVLNLIGGSGNDVFTTKTGNPNDGLNDTLSGGAGNDKLTVGGGVDNVDGGADIDTLIIDYSTELSAHNMNGASQITDFVNTTVNFTNIERFNVKLGSGNDNIVLLSGADTIAGGAGNDSLNTGAGAAVVDGGADNDLWIADFSTDATAKTIDLRLGGLQSAGNGTTYQNVEALNVNAGSGNDLLATTSLLLNDNLTAGDGDDTLAVGGGVDVIDGGLGNDLLIIDYSAFATNFAMNGGNQISNFINTTISFTGVEQFNVTLGSGNDSVVLGAGADTANGGSGDDTLNTGVGDAVVTGGIGNDLWIADQSLDTRVKSIDLNLTGAQVAGVGTTYQDIERMSVTTGSADDTLISRTGSGGNDGLYGGDGNDTIGVGFASDDVDGGLGTDMLIIDYSAATGNFSMNGANQITNFAGTAVNFVGIERFNVTLGNGNDSVVLGALSDTLKGGGGDDALNTGVGDARVDGGTGTDTWFGDLSAETANLTINLTLTGQQTAGGGSFYRDLEALRLSTGSGNDTLTTLRTTAADALNSGAGNDVLVVGGGVDTVDGGADNDLLIIDFSLMDGAFSMNGGNQITNFSSTSVSFSNIEQFNVTVNDNASAITLLDGDDTFKGGAGNDVVNMGAGRAVVDGGGGNDTWASNQALDNTAKTIDLNLIGVQDAGNGTTYASIEAISIATGSGADTIMTYRGIFGDNVSTGDGNDTISVAGGVDVVDGGIGDDLLIIDYSMSGGNFSMNGGNQITNFGNTTISFSGIERINASFGAGADNVTLGAGNDTMRGGLGNDILNAGLGSDTMDWRDATAGINVSVNGAGAGVATAVGIDTDTFTGFENFLLGSGDDRIKTYGADNMIDGGLGDDTLRGGGGVNTLLGGDGDDNIIGGGRRDYITGGLGGDNIEAGGGVTRYLYNDAAESGTTVATRDRITNFLIGTDKIDLRAIDAIAGGTDDAFNFLGEVGAFTGIGDIRLEQIGLNTLVRLNLDADPGTEMMIMLTNITAASVTSSEFLL